MNKNKVGKYFTTIILIVFIFTIYLLFLYKNNIFSSENQNHPIIIENNKNSILDNTLGENGATNTNYSNRGKAQNTVVKIREIDPITGSINFVVIHPEKGVLDDSYKNNDMNKIYGTQSGAQYNDKSGGINYEVIHPNIGNEIE